MRNPRARQFFPAVVLALAAFIGGLFACTSGQEPEAASLPSDLQADYLVFAQRCSKCHSLARPLNSGIDTDEYWKMYVERMRRQPASGISVADTVPILRFLHFYSIEQRKKKQLLLEGQAPDVPPSAAVPAAALPDAGAPDGGAPPTKGPH